MIFLSRNDHNMNQTHCIQCGQLKTASQIHYKFWISCNA